MKRRGKTRQALHGGARATSPLGSPAAARASVRWMQRLRAQGRELSQAMRKHVDAGGARSGTRTRPSTSRSRRARRPVRNVRAPRCRRARANRRGACLGGSPLAGTPARERSAAAREVPREPISMTTRVLQLLAVCFAAGSVGCAQAAVDGHSATGEPAGAAQPTRTQAGPVPSEPASTRNPAPVATQERLPRVDSAPAEPIGAAQPAPVATQERLPRHVAPPGGEFCTVQHGRVSGPEVPDSFACPPGEICGHPTTTLVPGYGCCDASDPICRPFPPYPDASAP
jgi:hypothetical protein